jgi:hypothetical protein
MTALGGLQWQIFDNCHNQFLKDGGATAFFMVDMAAQIANC